MNKIKILLADDHSIVRIGLSTLLQYEPDMSVVGEADDGEKAVELACRLKPDVVVMDLMMPAVNGVEATRRLRAAAPEIRILILTSFGSAAEIAEAVKAGASGAVVKHAANEELIEAIRCVADGGTVFSPEINLVPSEPDAVPDLTERQKAVLESAARGLSNQDISTQLGISKDMVKAHLKVTFRKLGAATRAEAVAIALRKHLLRA